MKKLVKSFLVVVTLLAMTMGMATLVSAIEPAVTVTEMVYTTDQPAVRSYVFNQNMKIGDGSAAGVVIPVKVTRPGVVQVIIVGSFEKNGYISASADVKGDGYLETGLYDSFETTDSKLVKVFNAKKAGTYYIRIFSLGDEAYTNNITVGFRYVSLKEKNVVLKKAYAIAAADYKNAQVFKYKATKTGMLIVGSGKEFGTNLTVLNGKKKTIIDGKYLSESNSYAYTFPVKKGQTYYIKVSGMSYKKINALAFKFEKVKEKSGKKRTKAVKLKAKKKAKGTVNIGDKGDWYKFTQKKNGKLQIKIKALESNDLKVTIYNSKGKQIDYCRAYTGTNTYKVTYSRTYGVAQKGTYYIKVSGYDKKKSNGYYELSWK